MRLASSSSLVFVCLCVAAAAAFGRSVHSVESTVDICEGKRPVVVGDAKGYIAIACEGQEPGKQVSDIFFVSSSDGGRNWTKPLDISKTPGNSEHPDIAIEASGAIDVVWADSTPGDSPDIYFARSADGGSTWTKAIDISNTPGFSSEPGIAAASDGKLHVVWSDTSKGDKNRDIFYSSSNDGGQNWGRDALLPADDISNTPGKSSEPAIAVDTRGLCHVTWVDTSTTEHGPEIYYASNAAGGWSKAFNLSNSPGTSSHPDIACGSAGRVYITWSDNSRKENARDIWCAVSKVPGRFAKPINISNTSGVSTEAAVAAANKFLSVVWIDTTNGEKRPDIWCRMSNDYGGAFTNATDLSNSPGVSKHPSVAICGQTMHTVWEEVQDSHSMLKMVHTDLGKMATGYAEAVDPTIRMHH